MKSLQTYMSSKLPHMINDIGGFIEAALRDAYLSGYEDALNATSNIANCITEYESTLTGDVFVRGSNGFFYNTARNEAFEQIPETIFIVPEYKPLAAVNRYGETFKVTNIVVYDNCKFVLHGILPKNDETILVVIGPSLQDHIVNSDRPGMKVVQLNDLTNE